MVLRLMRGWRLEVRGGRGKYRVRSKQLRNKEQGVGDKRSRLRLRLRLKRNEDRG